MALKKSDITHVVKHIWVTRIFVYALIVAIAAFGSWRYEHLSHEFNYQVASEAKQYKQSLLQSQESRCADGNRVRTELRVFVADVAKTHKILSGQQSTTLLKQADVAFADQNCIVIITGK